MTPLTWSRSFDTHIPAIDRQHRRLVGFINELDAAIQSGQSRDVVESVLDALVTYTHQHFGAEEHLMDRSAYPGSDAHRTEHLAFVKRLVDFRSAQASGHLGVSADLMSYLCEWVSSHLQETDRRFFEYLAAMAAQGHPAAQTIDLLAAAS